MKIINDTLKQDGKWSMSRLIVFFTFWANLFYAGWCIWKTAVFVDLPTNWLGLMCVMYGIHQTAVVASSKKETTGGQV